MSYKSIVYCSYALRARLSPVLSPDYTRIFTGSIPNKNKDLKFCEENLPLAPIACGATPSSGDTPQRPKTQHRLTPCAGQSLAVGKPQRRHAWRRRLTPASANPKTGRFPTDHNMALSCCVHAARPSRNIRRFVFSTSHRASEFALIRLPVTCSFSPPQNEYCRCHH